MSIADKILKVYSGVGGAFSAANSREADMPARMNLTTLPDTIRSIPVTVSSDVLEEKDVNYYDYEGTLLYSYTAEEFLELEEHPINPQHDGLISQGWNWTFQDAQDYVESHGYVDIGQNYITDDGATRIYIHVRSDLEKSFKNIKFSQSVANGVTVDWGDGTIETYDVTNNPNGTWVNSRLNAPHIYEELGDYCIRLIPAENCTLTLASSTYNMFSWYDDVTTGGNHSVYKVEIGRVGNTITNAFCGFTLEEGITIPNNIVKLDTAFKFSYGNFIVLPNSLTTIAGDCFLYAHRFRIVFPNSITSLSANAFGRKYWTPQLPILDNVANLNLSKVFSSTPFKRNLVIKNTTATTLGGLFACDGESRSNWKEIDLSGCTNLTTINSTFYQSYFSKVTLPESITTIGNNTFASSYGTKVNIPEAVTTVGASAFLECLQDYTQNISLPNLTVLNSNVFARCNFNSLSIPNVTTIANDACVNASIAHVYMPNVETIGNNAFKNGNLQDLGTMENLISVGSYAFANNVFLNSTLDAPNLQTIGRDAFDRCHLKGTLSLPNLTSLGNTATNNDCFMDNDFTEITNLGSITLIPNGSANTAGYFAFNQKLKRVVLPTTLTWIGNYAFRTCTALEEINIPYGVTTIGKDAFCNCWSLKHLDIPDTITSIGDYAIATSAVSMEYVIVRTTTPPTIGTNTFGQFNKTNVDTYPIYVPYGCAETYKAATNWKHARIVNRIFELDENGNIPSE